MEIAAVHAIDVTAIRALRSPNSRIVVCACVSGFSQQFLPVQVLIADVVSHTRSLHAYRQAWGLPEHASIFKLRQCPFMRISHGPSRKGLT
jgi:hypothetical protein